MPLPYANVQTPDINGAPTGRKMRVAVLMGGTSNEREVSLSTGRMIAGALDTSKCDVTTIDTRDLLSLQADKPDIVFIGLHGRGGEDGAVQGLLETLDLPYTGSGILASALAMDKVMSKRLFRHEGIPVAPELALVRGQELSGHNLIAQINATLGGFPVFVKPNAEGSSVGGTLAQDTMQLGDAVAHAFQYDTVILVEKYLRGMEVTVGVLGNTGETLDVLPVIEIVPKSAFYDYESKYAAGGSDHVIPARLSDAQTDTVQQIALQCHALLGCRGMSRTDFIITTDGPFVLEVNTIPGMTPTSLLPQAAAHAGIAFPDLLDRLIASALAIHSNRS